MISDTPRKIIIAIKYNYYFTRVFYSDAFRLKSTVYIARIRWNPIPVYDVKKSNPD